MYVDSLSRTFLVFLATLVLTACGGGGGGGGGGTILDPAPDPDEEELATGSIELSVVFSDDNSGNILAGNERATLRATANEDGADGELVVRFSTTGGTLVDSTASTSDGIATVEIIGDGSGTPATVTATVTLSDGTELSNEIIVQMSAAESSIELSIIFDEANQDGVLAGNEQATLQAIVNEEGATDELVVRFSSESDKFVDTSAATSDGIATVDIFGDGSGTPATVTATVTLSDGTELSDEIIVQMSPAESSIELSIIFDEANEDSILADSEHATLQAIVNEEGATDELVVQFSTTGGTLVETSASTSDGIATVEIVGDGSGTPATVTATVTLSDGTELSDEIIVQMSPSEDSMDLSVIFGGANDDNILAGNERATLQAIANEEGATGELVVRFSTTGGTLVETSAATIDGVATVEIIGDGSGTAAVVIATATLSDGTEISDEIIVQMSPAVSSDISSIELSIIFDGANEDNILAGNERATLQAIANEEGSTDELVVRFSTTGGTLEETSAATSDGIATVVIIGDGSGTPATVTATVTLSDGTEISDNIIVQMSPSENSIELSIIFDGANEGNILAVNEPATLQVIVNEEGSTDELVVRFSTTGGTLVGTSAATSDGIATIDIIGDGSGTAATVTATVTLSDGTEISDNIIVQMSSAEDSIALSISFDDANEGNILAVNEPATLQVIVNEEGSTDELVVRFSTTGGTLVGTSAATSDGIATIDIIGDGSGTPATVTATVTLSDGTEISDNIIVQMSSAEDSIALSISFDDANEGNILAVNESATLQVIVNEEGSTDELVVRFSTTGGTLVGTSAATSDGIATIDIIGDGSGTPATVTATVTLSDGTEISDNIIVQMSSAEDSIALSISFDDANEGNILAVNESATLQVIVNEEGSTDELVVRFSTTGGTLVETSASTSDGIATVVIIGDGSGAPATVTATVTLSDGTEISDNIIVQMSPSENSIELSIIFDGANEGNILAGNERATLQAIANEEGSTDELVVRFSTTGGTLVGTSAATSDGIATVDIIGDGSGTPATVTATVTLSDGTEITDDLTLQMSSDKPEISVVVRNINGVAITQFDSNVELTAEATVINWDGGALEGDDTELTVNFELGPFAEIANASALTAFEVCPVIGIKEKTDCAFINFTSSATAGTGDVIASATINGIDIEATVTIENTGTSGGIPDQNSFNITRIVGGSGFPENDTVALEGDEYNNEQATIRVNLGDFQENPVPDGAIVQFRTELGSITPSCEILSGTCDATFASGEPRSPTNSGVSFRNLDDDNCPSNYIEDEQVTVTGGTTALTDYRVANVLRVRQNNSPSIFTEGNQYTVNSNGIDCNDCANGQVLQITYQRLWLDEENDGSTAHVMLTPGTATEPFLDVQGTPCFANSRGNLEGITGSIEPAASTTVIGIGTRFLLELAVGDRIKVGNEVRTVASIANDTSLVVTAAFTAATNDTSPKRMAAPAYLGGLGQPYGARSTILAWTQGEESFDDTNANGQYDFGEAFNDLPEAFLDKNEDGVLDDNNGDSASAGTFPTTTGPYRDAGLGTNAPANSDVRQKNNPYCYGPETIVGESGDGNDSTEANKYCYQDGGEEEDFIDVDGNGLMDAGNGIYNGSRCINPEQNGATVCTTDLIDVRRETLVTLAGSRAKTSFRAFGANGLGGTFGSGEIIQGIENRSGIAVVDNPGLPSTWTAHAAPEPTPPPDTIVPTTLSNNLAGFPMGGAQIDTTVLNRDSDSIDNDEEVSLFTITNPFSRTQAIYEVSFEFAASAGAPRVGAIDLFINGVLQIDDCTSLTPVLPVTCTVSGLTGDDTGDLLFVVGKAPAASFRVVGTVHNVQITGTTTGTDGEFRSTEPLISNNRMSTNLTEFNIDEDLNINTVFPGVSERKAPSGNVPGIFTTRTTGEFWFTDRFNGQMPDGTTVQLSSAAAGGCQLTSAGGRAITTDTSDTFNVGTEVGTGLSFSVAQGGGGGGAIIATVTTPIGNQISDSISCNLLN